MALRHHATDGEIAVIFAFAFGVMAVLVLGLLRWVHAWRGRGKIPRPLFWPVRDPALDRRLVRLLDLACFGGLLCIAYGSLIGPTHLEVTRIRLTSPKIKPESGTIRLVHLSDLHSEKNPLNETRTAELVRGLRPDIVAITGDFLNDEAGLPVARELIGAVKAPFGVFLVRGNMDIGMVAPDAFEGLDAVVLDKQARRLSIRGTPLRISGLSVGQEPYFDRFFSGLGARGDYEVFLFHYTDLAAKAAAAGADLYLAGHTHGGQVRLPFYGALVTLAKLGKRFEAGLYRLGGMALYVNRGLGMEGGSSLRVRFLCRPEITLLELSAP